MRVAYEFKPDHTTHKDQHDTWERMDFIELLEYHWIQEHKHDINEIENPSCTRIDFS